MTGGTDFHGLYTKTPYPLGSFLCPKEGLHRLILAGEQANKAFYENILNSKIIFYKEESFFAGFSNRKIPNGLETCQGFCFNILFDILFI